MGTIKVYLVYWAISQSVHFRRTCWCILVQETKYQFLSGILVSLFLAGIYEQLLYCVLDIITVSTLKTHSSLIHQAFAASVSPTPLEVYSLAKWWEEKLSLFSERWIQQLGIWLVMQTLSFYLVLICVFVIQQSPVFKQKWLYQCCNCQVCNTVRGEGHCLLKM